MIGRHVQLHTLVATARVAYHDSNLSLWFPLIFGNLLFCKLHCIDWSIGFASIESSALRLLRTLPPTE